LALGAVLLAAAELLADAGGVRLPDAESRYSQFDEERIIRHFFEDRRDGVFVDVGAYLPTQYSTTYFLEKHLGWTGLAIDAQAWLADRWTRDRPNARFFTYIVTDHSGTMETLFLAGPISSTKKGHVGDVLPDKADAELQAVSVPTMTLNELLDREGFAKIDFLSMDIEQGEPAALAGFDIERFAPELVCVEAFGPINEQLLGYFAAHGYERIDAYLAHDEHNWYFRRKQSRPR
jgi:FkbM family methyltransferase